LHQKLKFVVDDKLIIVFGEEDLVVCGSTSTPYIEAIEEALETSFQALEIVSTTYVEPFKVNPCLSSASLIVAKTMMKEGYKYGSGLGKNNTGSVRPLKLVENKGRYGLGYKPTHADRRRIIEERIERSQAKIEGQELRIKEISMPSLDQSFFSAGWINFDQVAVIEQRHGDQSFNHVHPCLPDEEIGNWESVDVPMVFSSDKM